MEVAKYLVEHGADVNAVGFSPDNTLTALQLVAEKGDMEMVQYLVEHGADVNATASTDAFSVLQLVAARGDIEMVQYLVEHGVDVKAKNRHGNGLHSAVIAGRLETTKYLVASGADAKAKDASGSTAAHIAAAEGNMEIFLYLIEEVGIRNFRDIVGDEAFTRWENINLYATFVTLADKLFDTKECQRWRQRNNSSEVKQKDCTKKLVYAGGADRGEQTDHREILRAECPHDLGTAFFNRFRNKISKEGAPQEMFIDPNGYFEKLGIPEMLKIKLVEYINHGRERFIINASSLIESLEKDVLSPTPLNYILSPPSYFPPSQSKRFNTETNS